MAAAAVLTSTTVWLSASMTRIPVVTEEEIESS